jgi:hypothetical protein
MPKWTYKTAHAAVAEETVECDCCGDVVAAQEASEICDYCRDAPDESVTADGLAEKTLVLLLFTVFATATTLLAVMLIII